MKFLLFILLLSTGCAIKRPIQAQLEIVPARYSLEDNGFLKVKPCDPPLAKEELASGVMCSERSQSWTIRCDDPRAVEILPTIENSWAYDFGKAKERGEKFWCVIPVEKISAIQRYQERATKKCLEKYSPEECKPATGCVHDQYGDCTPGSK